MKRSNPETTKSDASLPLVPVDPRDVGPQQLAAQWIGWGRSLLDRYSREILLTSVVTVALMWHFGIGLPRVPDWLLVGVGGVVFMAPPALIIGFWTAWGLYRPDSILVKEIDAASGDTRLLRLSPERWDDLDIVSPNGKRRGREFLERISVNSVPAYEVDRVDFGRDLVIVSDMAGRTKTQIRRDREEIYRAATELEREADKSLTMMLRSPSILRRLGRRLSRHMTEAVERVEDPTDESLHEEFMQIVDDANPAEDLLEESLRPGVDSDVSESDESDAESASSQSDGSRSPTETASDSEVSTSAGLADRFDVAAAGGTDD